MRQREAVGPLLDAFLYYRETGSGNTPNRAGEALTCLIEGLSKADRAHTLSVLYNRIEDILECKMKVPIEGWLSHLTIQRNLPSILKGAGWKPTNAKQKVVFLCAQGKFAEALAEGKVATPIIESCWATWKGRGRYGESLGPLVEKARNLK